MPFSKYQPDIRDCCCSSAGDRSGYLRDPGIFFNFILREQPDPVLLRANRHFYALFRPHFYESVDLSTSRSNFYRFVTCLEKHKLAPPIDLLKLRLWEENNFFESLLGRLVNETKRLRLPFSSLVIEGSEDIESYEVDQVKIRTLFGSLVSSSTLLEHVFLEGEDSGESFFLLNGLDAFGDRLALSSKTVHLGASTYALVTE